jgi:hypothetical protein
MVNNISKINDKAQGYNEPDNLYQYNYNKVIIPVSALFAGVICYKFKKNIISYVPFLKPKHYTFNQKSYINTNENTYVSEKAYQIFGPGSRGGGGIFM